MSVSKIHLLIAGDIWGKGVLIHIILKDLHNLFSSSLVATENIFIKCIGLFIKCIGYWKWRFAVLNEINFFKWNPSTYAQIWNWKLKVWKKRSDLIHSFFLRSSCILVWSYDWRIFFPSCPLFKRHLKSFFIKILYRVHSFIPTWQSSVLTYFFLSDHLQLSHFRSGPSSGAWRLLWILLVLQSLEAKIPNTQGSQETVRSEEGHIF